MRLRDVVVIFQPFLVQVSKDLTEKIHDCSILKSYEEEANLSDHCPIGLTFRM